MKSYFLLAIFFIIVFSSCQHYVSVLPPDTTLTGTWTFQKDTITVTYGDAVVKKYINNINPGSTLQFDSGSEDGSITYVASPDTTLVFTYAYVDYNAMLSLTYPGQTVFGVYNPGQIINYTFIKSTAHLLELNYTSFFTDPQGTAGEIYADYYWTK